MPHTRDISDSLTELVRAFISSGMHNYFADALNHRDTEALEKVADDTAEAFRKSLTAYLDGPPSQANASS